MFGCGPLEGPTKEVAVPQSLVIAVLSSAYPLAGQCGETVIEGQRGKSTKHDPMRFHRLRGSNLMAGDGETGRQRRQYLLTTVGEDRR